jgi:hypothetical protein
MSAEILYCALCACPCRCPVADGALPTTPDTAFTDPTHQAKVSPSWLNHWEYLQEADGLLPSTISSGSPTTCQPTAPVDPAPKRQIPIHNYCLQAVLEIIKDLPLSSSQSPVAALMLHLGLPRWAGHGPWVKQDKREMIAAAAESISTWTAKWSGTVDQRKRWAQGKEGSHLLEVSACLS